MRIQDFGHSSPSEEPSGLLNRLQWLYAQYRRAVATCERRKLLDPNRYSDIKVARYSMGISKEVTLGQSASIEETNRPDVTFRPREIRCNVERSGMVFVRSIQVANVGCIVGGEVDAYCLRNIEVDYPTLTPANTLVVVARYTGKMPYEHSRRQTRAWNLMLQERHDFYRYALESAVEQKTLAKTRKVLIDALNHSAWSNVAPPLEKFEFNISFHGPASIAS